MNKTMFLIMSFSIGVLVAEAGLPLPCVNYYGLLSDEYGSPFLEYAEIQLFSGTNQCDRFVVDGLLDAGVNFELQLEVDSGGTLYAPYAVHVGDPVQVVVTVGGVEVDAIFPVNFISAANSGDSVQLNIFTGMDQDGDGLPDSWEELLMSQSGGFYTNIQQITKSGDFDGDGSSNGDEFLAGTFPFLAYDIFSIDGVEQVNNRIGFEFLALSGKVYTIQTSSGLTTNSWVNTRFAVDEFSDLDENIVIGNGAFKSIYIGIDEDTKFIRIGAD